MFSPHTPASQVTRVSIQKSGGLDAACAVTGLSRAQLSNYQNEGQPYHIPLPVAAELDRFTPEPYHLLWLCTQLGLEPPATKSSPVAKTDPLSAVLRLAKEVGDVADETANAFRDRVYTKTEIRRIREEAQEAAQVLEQLFHCLAEYEASLTPKAVEAAE